MAQKILVASGKGGVGKTTICTQVGAALARRGLRVLTAELDAGFRSMDLLLELESGVVFDLADVLEGRCAPDAAVQTHASSGLRVLLAPADPGYGASAQGLKQLSDWAESRFDMLLFDCPAGFGAIQRAAAACCGAALLVTLPEPVACRAAARVSGLLRSLGVSEQRLIINRVSRGRLPCGDIRDMDDVIDMTGVRLIGAVPEAAVLPAPAGRAGISVPEQALDRIAARLLGEPAGLLIE